MAGKDKYDWPAEIKKAIEGIKEGRCEPKWISISRYLNISPSTIKYGFEKQGTFLAGLKEYAPDMVEIENGVHEDQSVNDWVMSANKEGIHTLDELLKWFNVDLRVWEVERHVNNAWAVTMKIK